MAGNALLPGVLSAVKLVLDAIRGHYTPEKKRERLAKDLLKLYLDLVEIVGRGQELVSYVGPDKPVADNIPIEVLRSQQAALISFQKHLDNVAAILELHLPSGTARLEVLTTFKAAAVAFLLTFLIEDMPRITMDDAAFKAPEVQALVEKSKSLGLEWEVYGLIPLPEKPWIWDPNFEDWDVHTALIASAADIAAVQRVLDDVAAIQEELRQFLIEKFKIEDLL